MRVAFDIDDVQMPWIAGVHKACAEAGLTELDKEWTQWEAWLDYGCSKEQWLEVVDSLVIPNGIYQTEPYPGVVDAITRVYEAGHDVHFVTARGFFAHSDQIRRWTYQWVLDWYSHIPVKLSFAQKKGPWCRDLGITHAIDDSMKNVLDLRDCGIDAYLMNQPHNAALQYPDNRRVVSVVDFAERILNG